MNRKSEQILLTVFVLLVLGMLSWKLWQEFDRRLDLLTDREHALELRKVESEVYLEQREVWLARMNWVEESQPALASADQVDNELVDLARAPSASNVSTEALKLLEPVETESYSQAGISFTAKGKLRDIFGWLHGLQKPEEFRAIRRLKVTPDKAAPDRVTCEVELLRWYAP